MKAQLRDGLHGEPGLRLVQELQELLPRLLGRQALLDLIACRHGPRSQGLAPHCLDGFLAVMMWLGDTAGSSVTISDLRKTTDNHCSSPYARVGPAPSSTLDDFLSSHDIPLVPHMGEEIPCEENRAVILRTTHAVTTSHVRRQRAFDRHPVDLILLFGENHAEKKDRQGTRDRFLPTFEGKTDSWGGHYYAQDHDHR